MSQPQRGNRVSSWRSVAALAVSVGLGGCGWRPVYETMSDPGQGARGALARVDVSLIPERTGQLLRQALQARLQGDASAASPAFVLEAGYGVSQEGIGYTSDNSISRVRMVATSSFVLRGLAVGSPTCVAGSVTRVDGFDEVDQQFFDADLAAEGVQRRLANAVADEIVMKLALAFSAPGRLGCAVSRS